MDGSNILTKKLEKIILKKYHKYFYGENSVPLIKTLSEKIICNEFSNSFSKEKIYSIYNFSSNKTKGRILKLSSAVKEFKQIYGKSVKIKIEKKQNNFYLLANLDADDVMLLYIKFDI